ncbi:hypothetical protein SAMN07250955_106176 [Arboricoccus pini]|uniref:Uncharacterized protein n=1 Tax=Arboricoccus pini TaxID=1963835 RepID=A0A212R8E1_9PROT|nr:hypothetical protein [Arboricoccus pini]SNB68358.1 hypothetical protein SAMN07250955_106176 [Arboricoccus pini]
MNDTTTRRLDAGHRPLGDFAFAAGVSLASWLVIVILGVSLFKLI